MGLLNDVTVSTNNGTIVNIIFLCLGSFLILYYACQSTLKWNIVMGGDAYIAFIEHNHNVTVTPHQ